MRKWKDVTIDAEGRDKGKTYRITEMSASAGERWGTRALGCAAKAGVRIPDEMLRAGMAGFAAIIGSVGSFLAGPRDEVDALMAEMFGCIQSVQPAAVRALVEEDIEEIATRLWLRDEVLELHTGFSLRAESLKALATYLMTRDDLLNTQTGQAKPSEASSPADLQPLPN